MTLTQPEKEVLKAILAQVSVRPMQADALFVIQHVQAILKKLDQA